MMKRSISSIGTGIEELNETIRERKLASIGNDHSYVKIELYMKGKQKLLITDIVQVDWKRKCCRIEALSCWLSKKESKASM
jgi:hypothetical protein